MFALIDMNNFYANCERLFQPELRSRPLIVLSNNDGCAIARSDEAKALGVKMGQALHLIPPAVRRQLAVRSANFTLYGDISARIGTILREAAPRIETYSIDESFLDLQGMRDRTRFAFDLRARVQRWTGIANCVGIGPTKTLAKLANYVAKSAVRKPGSYPASLGGVANLAEMTTADLYTILRATPVDEVWGVGRKWGARLREMGITTAADLRDAPVSLVLERFGVVLARTQQELAGSPCIDLQEVEPDRQQIMVSRSFGAKVGEHEAVFQALATFAVRACEKLRQRSLTTAAVGIFVGTDVFDRGPSQHFPHRSMNLSAATSDTRIVLEAVRQMHRGMLKPKTLYKRAGVWLMDLARPQVLQRDLFGDGRVGDDELMAAIDAINNRWGRGTIGVAASGWAARPQWAMRQRHLSRRWTTSIADLPVVRC